MVFKDGIKQLISQRRKRMNPKWSQGIGVPMKTLWKDIRGNHQEIPLGLWKDANGNYVHATHIAKTLDGDIFVMVHLVNDESPSRNLLYPVAEFLATFVLYVLEDDITEDHLMSICPGKP